MNQFMQKYDGEFNGVIDHFRQELGGIRAGRANPSMVENILADMYGVKTPIKQMASIGVQEARVMVIQPWDKNLIKEIEKAITMANLGLSVSSEMSLVRVTVPQMTEENRKELVKILNEKLEAAKVALRSVRENMKEEIVDGQKNGDITEDDRYQYIEEMEKKVAELNKVLQDLTEAKEKEIMSV
jgi:ribosome recycling factor